MVTEVKVKKNLLTVTLNYSVWINSNFITIKKNILIKL